LRRDGRAYAEVARVRSKPVSAANRRGYIGRET
jgi:hypothetical protein